MPVNKEPYTITEKPITNAVVKQETEVLAAEIVENACRLTPPKLITHAISALLQKINALEVKEMDIKHDPFFDHIFVSAEKYGTWLLEIGFKPFEWGDPVYLPKNGIINQLYVGGLAPMIAPIYRKNIVTEKKITRLWKNKEFDGYVESKAEKIKIISGTTNAFLNSVEMYKNSFAESCFYQVLRVINRKVYNTNYEVFDPTKDYTIWNVIDNVSQGIRILQLENYKDATHDSTKHKVFASIYKEISHTEHPDFTTTKQWVDNGYLIVYDNNQYILPALPKKDSVVDLDSIDATWCVKLSEIVTNKLRYIAKSNFEGYTLVAGPRQNHYKNCTMLIAPFLLQKYDSLVKANTFNPEYLTQLTNGKIKVMACDYLDRHYMNVYNVGEKDENIPPILVQGDDLWHITEGETHTYIRDISHYVDEEGQSITIKKGFNMSYSGFELDVKIYHEDDIDHTTNVPLEQIENYAKPDKTT